MKTLWTAARALFFASGFLFIAGWLALRLRTLDGRIGLALPLWTPVLGWVIAIPALAIELLCIGTFVVGGHGTPAPFDAPRQVVAAGLYRYVRNPMYIAGLGLLAAFGLYLRSVSVVLFAVVWSWFTHLGVVYLEEPDLRRKFGASYDEYCRSVPRWIPQFSKRPEQAKTAAPR